MKNRKLYKVFRALSGKQLQKLTQFLNSPFFTSRKDFKSLFQWLKSSDQANPLTLEEAHQAVYPNKVYVKQGINRLVSDLFKKTEEYLTMSAVSMDEAVLQKKLLLAYRQLNLESQFKKTWTVQQKEWQAKSSRSAHYWHHQYEMEFAYYDYIGSQTREAEKIEEMAKSFDIYLIAERLKIGCLQIAHEAVRNKKYDKKIIESLVQHIEKHPPFLDYPAIGIYYYCYKMLTHQDQEKHYQNFYQLFEDCQVKKQFSVAELSNLHLLTVNYWIRAANTGEPMAIEKAFQLYHYGLVQGFLLDGGHITDAAFINVVALALRLPQKKGRDKATLVESLINQFKEKLRPKDKENLILFNRARLAHYHGNYKEAMPLQAQITFAAQPYLRLLSATLLLKMYYEQEEIGPLQDHLTSMKNYIGRKPNLSDKHKANFLNVIKFTRKLIRLPLRDKVQKETLRQQILQTSPLGEKKWLLKQVSSRTKIS